MINKKIKLFIVTVFILVSFTIACGKKAEDEVTEQELFIEKAINLINIVNYNADMENYQNNYNKYVLENGLVVGKNFNINTRTYNENINLDLPDYKDVSGLILQNYNNEFYLSLKNDKYCLVKDYSWEEPQVYSLSDEKKCHLLKTDINDNEIKLAMFNYIPDINQVYESGTESNYPVILQAINNIYDASSIIYKWYRNGIEIENSNNILLQINESEDAIYYAELIVDDVISVKTEEIHVIVKNNK